MAIDKALLARHFARAAPEYDVHARVQERAADALVNEVRRRSAGVIPRRVLDVGCGTGTLTARLLDVWPGASALALDLAEGMIAAAAQVLARRAVQFVVGDIEAGFPDERFDVIASSMALQWVHDPATVLRGAAVRLAERGFLALAIPVAGTLGELRAAYAGAAADLGLAAWSYPGLEFHEPDRWAAWARAVFRDVEVREKVFVERHPDARGVLQSIRGVGGNHCESRTGPAAIRLLRAALTRYDAQNRDAGGVCATWRLALVTARGPLVENT